MIPTAASFRIAGAVLALLLLLDSEARVRQGENSAWNSRTRWLLFLAAAMVSVTGHLGGILTFGVEYLNLPW